MKSLQKFASVHANIHNHFNLERHIVDRETYKAHHSATLAEWQSLHGLRLAARRLSSARWRRVAVRLTAPPLSPGTCL